MNANTKRYTGRCVGTTATLWVLLGMFATTSFAQDDERIGTLQEIE